MTQTDIQQAASLTAQALAINAARETLLNDIATWTEVNPYKVYADYRDCISDEQAAMLLNGEFDAFHESIEQWESNAFDYAEWSEHESELLSEFAERIIECFPDDDIDDDSDFDDLPQEVQDAFNENTWIDCSDLIESAISSYDGMIAATLYKRNGEPIEFQGAWGQEWDASAARYLKRYCDIDPRKSEPTYAGTYVKALGTLDLLQIYKTGKAPTHVLVSKDIMTIGHEALNGSGTLGDDQYKGKPRWYRARFTVDATSRYGVDSVFGLTGCWRTELTVKTMGNKS